MHEPWLGVAFVLACFVAVSCSGGHVGNNPCEDRECGQVEGHDCGTCPGATEVCDERGLCADLCAERECGSPAPGVECGDCAPPEQCGLSGRCYSPGGCPVGTVEVPDQGYCIDAFEVTNERMHGFMATSDNRCIIEEISAYNPTHPDTAFCMTDFTHDEFKLWLDGDTWRIRPGFEQNPVVGVTWQGAVTACRAWGGDLCTLPQWQLACTGPQELRFPYGDEYDGDACNACYWDQVCTPSGGTVEVGSYPTCEGGYPGLFDMSGNVFEWLWECKATNNGGDDVCVRVGGAWSGSWKYDGCYEDPTIEWTWRLPYAFDEVTGFRCCYELP